MINFSRSFAKAGQEDEEPLRPVSPVSSLRYAAPTSPQPAASSSSTSPNLSRGATGINDWDTGAFHETIPLDDYLQSSSEVSELNILGLPRQNSEKRSSIRRVPVGSKATVTPQSSNNDMRDSWRENMLSSPDTLIGSPIQSGKGRQWSGFASFKSRVAKNHYRRRSLGFEALDSHFKSISEEERAAAASGEFDNESFYKGFGDPPSFCWSKENVQQKRRSRLSIIILVLSIYSTVMSGLWLVVALVQPRWGRQISSRHGLQPSTATTLATWVAKTIEMSFVTVVIAFIGQVLSRRAFVRGSRGMTLAETTMRNWVIQPGSMFTHFETVRYALFSVLGALALLSSLTAMLYTTASDAMVSPKLKYGRWEHKELSGYVRSSYANSKYIKATCPGLRDEEGTELSSLSCMDVQLSGEGYRNLMGYMQEWADISWNGTSLEDDLDKRPVGTARLNETTFVASWIETQHSNVSQSFEKHGRLINNVTMAMPHPGVASAAMLSRNGILQPDDLSGVGEYAVRAGVVSPSVNAMCVNLAPDELSPLIYTEWPNSNTTATGVGDQKIGWDGWWEEVPKPLDTNDKANFLNRTDLDDIFRWGPTYGRRPPVFQLFPADYNMIINSTVHESDAMYLLGKAPTTKDYTLCELRSWLSPNCSTHFNVSLTTGNRLSTHCEDPLDENNYIRSFDKNQDWSFPSTDWKWIADQWQKAANLNGGVQNNNASNARILTQLVLTTPELPAYEPSLAEALAVFAGSTVVRGSVDTPFRHYWSYKTPGNMLGEPGVLQQFNASVVTQEYTSGHIESWQGTFYLVLILAFFINLLCAFYFVLRGGLVTDYTESQNLCALAVNSPPTEQLKGSCGGGPQGQDLVVPWRVAYAPSANHYFLEEAKKAWKRPDARERANAPEADDSLSTASATYKRLSNGRGWL